ncbi:hypothetical protein, partial [Deinococcus wulumuqiensis]|uniref:hypothetical protein n=1 Tax=Deinococcus wulumuqiensis TaxID=980427 RepID=UPI00242F873E
MCQAGLLAGRVAGGLDLGTLPLALRAGRLRLGAGHCSGRFLRCAGLFASRLTGGAGAFLCSTGLLAGRV